MKYDALISIGILLFLVALPFLIFKFVVKATERDLANVQGQGSSDFIAENWLWGGIKCAVWFSLVAPLFTLGLASLTFMAGGDLVVLLTNAPATLVLGASSHFLAGLAFALLVPTFSAGCNPSWWWRMFLGAICGAVAGNPIIIIDDNIIPLAREALPPIDISSVWLAIAAGALCGLSIQGQRYRQIFLKYRVG